jgi:hypothetical protein
MTPDSLKQLGKNLGKTNKDSEYNSSRFSKNFSLIEIIRDSFNSDYPFITVVKVYGSNQKTNLNLYFFEPFCRCNSGGIG